MADYNSSLPVRTENNGDVAARIVDGTVTSQALNVDAAGKVHAKLNDGAGTEITSQANGAQQALDVGINVAGVQVDPRDIRALTNVDVVTVEQPTHDSLNANANIQVGNTDVSNGNPVPVSDAGGSITVDGTVSASNFPATVDTNYGTVGVSTIRTASQIGNSTGAANFNNGATGAQTLRVAANLAVAGADVTASNPVPVTISVNNPGTEVNNYNTAAAVAGGASSNHDYTVTGGTTLLLTQIEASGSGRAKIEVQIETGAGTGVFNTRFVQFNSTSSPNMAIKLAAPISVAAGARVRIIRSNRDNQAQDLYSTISGQEV